MASLLINNGSTRWIVIFYIIFNKLIVAYHQQDTHNVAKRMDIESCEGHFNIQREMIIRTEESRKLGAKYLDFAEMGSREECLRLCCETDECDVFVYEEKSTGSCFLFHCGPAQNFRCKFVEHSNYTSAVLTPAVKKIQPQPQSSLGMYPARPPTPASLSQHEIELSNLKGKSNRFDQPTTANPPIAEITTTKASTVVTAAAVGNADVRNDNNKGSKQCSRFQFPCHSGECIAIYNACDGIPQCFDGSDESPGCPTTVSPIIKNANTQNKVDGRLLQQNSNNILQSTFQKNLQQQLYNGVAHNREDPMTAPQSQWIVPNRAVPMDDAPQPYIDSSSHIFNHKGGIQISNNNNNHPPIYAPNTVHNNNIDITNPYEVAPPRGSYMQMQNVQGLMQNWPQQIPQFPDSPRVLAPHEQQPPQQNDRLQPNQMMVDPQVQQEMMRSDWPVRPLLPANVLNNVANNAQPAIKTDANDKLKSMNAVKTHKTSQKDNDQDTGDSTEDKDSEYDDDEKPTEPPKKKSRKHKKTENKDKLKKIKEHATKTDGQYDVVQKEMASQLQANLNMEFMDHDGAAERPGGAVLSLTLGVIITAALAILVGCRANVVRRRVRRGAKSAYAHDADFLVNGMYL